MPLSVRMLGPFDLSPVAERCSRKAGWVLALLALRPGREVDRAFLAGTLWPETSESQALYDLRRELSRLRRALGDEAERIRSVGAHALTLELAGAQVDVVAFDEAVTRGDLERAVDVYRGPLLVGCTEGWAIEAREGRAQAYLGALEALAGARADARRSLRGRRRRASCGSPSRPILCARGRSGRSCGRWPRAGRTPRPRRPTASCASSWSASSPWRRIPRRAPSTRSSARRRRRRSRPRCAARRSALAHPPPRAGPRPTPRRPGGAAWVRVPLTLAFVGRSRRGARDLERRVGATRLLTLTGTGGVGKSRLAIQVASDLWPEDFADGPGSLEFAPLADPGAGRTRGGLGARACTTRRGACSSICWSASLARPERPARPRQLRARPRRGEPASRSGCSTPAPAAGDHRALLDAVAGGDVLDPLANLVDKSLVGFSTRYRLLETVRQFAAERLAERGETDEARGRHLDHFVRLAEAAEPRIFGGDGDRAWIARLEEENDNLRAAFDFCQAPDPPAAPRDPLPTTSGVPRSAAARLRPPLVLACLRPLARGPPGWRPRCTGTRALPPPCAPARSPPPGYVAMWAGDYAAMSEPFTEALVLARDLGDLGLSAYALCGSASAATGRRHGRCPPFAAEGELARAHGEAHADRGGMLLVFALYWLGAAEHGLGTFEAARRSLGEGPRWPAAWAAIRN